MEGREIPIVKMDTIEPLEDLINKPRHYHKGDIDVIAIMALYFSKEQLEGFHRGNVLKYLLRCEEKGGYQDLEKASAYLKKLMELKAPE